MKSFFQRFRVKNLRTRLMIVAMMVFFAMLAVMYFGVPNFAGPMWAAAWGGVSPEVLFLIQETTRKMVLLVFAIVLPFWMVGAMFLTGRFVQPLVNLTESAEKISQPGGAEEVVLDEGSSMFTSTEEIQHLKGMLGSMMGTIRANDEQFRSIVSNQRELIFRWKPDFTLTFVNQAFCEFFDLPESFLLQSSGEVLRENMLKNYPDLANLVENQMLTELQFSNDIVDETFLKMPDGETHWVQWQTMALYDDEGNITECQTIGHVLTDLKLTQMELEDANHQLVALSQELIRSQEEERITVARFLHDQVLGELGEMARSPDESVDEKTVQQMIDRLRSTIYMMRSPMLNYGLSMALEDLCDHMKDMASEKEGMEFQYGVEKSLARFDTEVETQIYRIIQEACKNAFEHAGASTITLSGVIKPKLVELTVEDNGSGFELKEDESVRVRAQHYGMIGMEERCNIIGAQFKIDSWLGAGTRVRVRWTPELHPDFDRKTRTQPLRLPEI